MVTAPSDQRALAVAGRVQRRQDLAGKTARFDQDGLDEFWSASSQPGKAAISGSPAEIG